MKQAIHIFHKDLRRLWPALAIALALQLLFTYFEMQPHRTVFASSINSLSPEALVDLLLPVAWWYLICTLIHQEALPGDRQFWITRPYAWKNLLASKLLLILLFINLPVALADCLILRAQGFSIGAHAAALLWHQIPFSLLLLLPPFALGSVTRHLGQVILVVLLILLRLIVNSIPSDNPIGNGSVSFAWIGEIIDAFVFLAVFTAIVWIQYRSRRTWWARGILTAFVIFPGLPTPLGWQLSLHRTLNSPAVDLSQLRITFDPARGRRMPLIRYPRSNYANIVFPVSISGVPEGVEPVSSQADLIIAGNRLSEGATLERDPRGYWEAIVITADLYRSLQGKPVSIRIAPIVTAVRNTQFRASLERVTVAVPEVGICESGRQPPELLIVSCRWAFRSPPRTLVHADYPGWDSPQPSGRPNQGLFGELSDSPFPAEAGISPVHSNQVLTLGGRQLTDALAYPGTQLVFETMHPVANVRTEFEMQAIRLEDYAIAAPRQ